MRVKILKRNWNLAFVPLSPHRGDCDAPTTQNKQIRVATRLKGEEQLEVTIHEMLHACGWHIDEEFVAEAAEDMARVLWRLGYRRESK